MSESMDEAHRRDSKTERLMRDAARALDDVLDNDERVSVGDRAVYEAARDRLRERAAHIVAVWD